METRYFFHLVDSQNVIRDDLGALATDLTEAYRAAAEVVKEFQIEQARRADEWKDWRLVVTEESANFTLVIPLSPDAPKQFRPDK